MNADLKAPFPWFGGKSRVADLVWQRLGADVCNYVEPFFGSGAVLLGRPGYDAATMTETINDKDGFVCNFWRAIQADPEEVAAHADWPQNENDLHARHAWLIWQRATLAARLEGDPAFYDAKIAGWWVWGLCLWIGSGWCSGNGPWGVEDGKLLHLGNRGRGINRQLLHLGNRGQGINRQLLHLGDRGRGIKEWFEILAERLHGVRICSGDWARVCGPSVTFKHGVTGVFLDPPYGDEAERCDDVYAEDSGSVAADVRTWCRENGDNKLLRIALCGYAGEHDELEKLGWEAVAWKARGGYGSQGDGDGRANAARERIWFSPHCLHARQGRLF